MTETVYTVTPRMAHEFIVDCLLAGLVPFVQGSPGIGKSSIMRNVSQEFGLHMIDHRLSTSGPEDLTGLPQFKDGKARFAPFEELFPLADAPLPRAEDGSELNGWMIFFDEMNAATKPVQAASYKVILDKMIGQHRLHPRAVITAAGNLSTDRAIVNSLSTAMQSRLVHIILQHSFSDWLQDVALKEKYDPRIVAYLSYKEGSLLDFRPDHQENTFCCPRTWEFMNRLIKDKPVEDRKIALYAGTITSGVAVDFVQFTKVFGGLPNIRDVINDPEHLLIPAEPPARYATITHLLDNVSDKNLDKVAIFINRFSAEFRVLFYRGIKIRRPDWIQHPVFIKALVELDKYLND